MARRRRYTRAVAGIAHCRDDLDWIAGTLERVQREAQPHIDLRLCATSERGPAVDTADMVAVVLVLQPGGANDPRFAEVVRQCTAEVARRQDFRCFVLAPRGSDVGALVSANGLYADLLDAVQVVPDATPQDVGEWLTQFLHELSDVRREAAWRRIGAIGAIMGGELASVAQWSCTAVALGVACLMLGNVAGNSDALATYANALAVVSQVAAFRFAMLTLFELTHRGWSGEASGTPVVRWSSAWSAVAVPVLLQPLRLRHEWAWTLLGLCAGGLLEAARRAGIKARFAIQQVDTSFHTRPGHKLPARLTPESTAIALDPSSCDIFSRRHPLVFVSYARASRWAQAASAEVRRRLVKVGARSFRDLDDLAPGASWRRELSHRIGTANLVVCIVDAVSVGREWPAAELELALEKRRRSGNPDIVLLLDPDLTPQKPDPAVWLPAFRAIALAGDATPIDGSIQVVPYNEKTVGRVVDSCRYGRFRSRALLPPLAEEIARRLWFLPRLVIALIGGTSTAAGQLIPLVVIYDLLWPPASIVDRLVTSGFGTVAFLAGVVGLGTVCRLAANGAYEQRDQEAAALYHRNRNAALGLATWLGYLAMQMPALSPLTICWTAPLFAIRWIESALLSAEPDRFIPS